MVPTSIMHGSRGPRLADVEIEHLGPVNIFRNKIALSESDQKELHFWEHDPGEGPNSDIFENVIYKSRVMLTFLRALKFMNVAGSATILEVGSGQISLQKQRPNRRGFSQTSTR